MFSRYAVLDILVNLLMSSFPHILNGNDNMYPKALFHGLVLVYLNIHVEPLCCTLESDIILHLNYTSKLNK